VLSESNAILRYLAAREGRDDLYPDDARDRARVEMLLDRWSLTFRPALFRYEAEALGFAPGKGMGGREPDVTQLPELARAIAPTLHTLDALIDPSGTALGRFTIADVAAAPVLFRTTKTGLELSPYPNVERWRDTVTARPAFAAAEPII